MPYPPVVTATAYNGEILLQWTPGFGVNNSYSIYRSTTPGGEGAIAIATGDLNANYIDTGLKNGQTYYYTVEGVNSVGASAPSNEVSATPNTAPQVPIVFLTSPNDESDFFQWTTSTGATSYNIYRSTVSGGEGSTPYATGVTTASFNDTNLVDGVTYYYQISAVGPGGQSATSTEFYLTPIALHAYPPILNSATAADGQVTLSWTPGVGVTNTYNVFRSTSPGGEGSTPIRTGITATTFTDTGLSDGTTYYYQIQGVNSTGPTNLSGELAARPVSASTPVYGAVAGQQAVAAASYNLTQLGTLDWIHWEAGGSRFETDRKSSGGSQISDVTLYGPAPTIGTASDQSRASTWTDGSPTATATNNSAYILSNGALKTGYSFTVPADTTTRTLYVYAGGNGASSSIRAHLSDGSAADYVATDASAGIYTDFYTITYKAASAGQTLTLTELKTGNIAGTSGSVDLIAAALATPPVLVAAPAAPVLNSATAGDGQIALSWTPGAGVNTSYSVFRSTASGSEGATPIATGITGTTFTDTGLSDGTTYYYTVEGVNSSGSSKPSNELLAKPVAVTVISTGALSGTQVTAAASYNLTQLGSTDWIHFGRGGSYNAVDRKSTGGSKISNVSSIGSGAVAGGYSTGSRTSTWTDGSPTSSTSTEHGYIWSNGALNTGFTFTVPAGTTQHTLYIYAGGVGITSTLRAHLSDGSAADYVATVSNAGNFNSFYAITFKAASANQLLTITLTKSANITGTQGSVDLIAAAMA